jgi:hypothetical protein
MTESRKVTRRMPHAQHLTDYAGGLILTVAPFQGSLPDTDRDVDPSIV